MAITSERLIELIENAGYEARSYSGRAMYGEQCVALVTDDPEVYVGAQIVLSADDESEQQKAAQAMRGARTDSMGLSTVIYFPRFPWQVAGWQGADDDN